MAGFLTVTGALRAWYSIGIVVLTAILVMIGSVVYTSHQQQRSDRRWCAMLAIQASPSPPPSTPRGSSTQAEAARLADAFGCPKETK
ncbi:MULTISPECIES: hypothetical protein [Actinocorallia]|uniref:Uncharacterized protein n=2 Tax=Actinocorallia TaxID=58108 RepID=A0ABN3US34_9ACTN